MAVLWAALMPHPPVLVPAVGKGREQEAGLTLNGVKALCAALAQIPAPPQALLLLSPHLPPRAGSLFVNSAPTVQGSLARFGAPAAAVSAPLPGEALRELADTLDSAGIPATYGQLPDITPDHGSTVPLLLLKEAFPGGVIPPLITASPIGLTPELALKLGKALRALPDTRRWALLASGDLSHRLKEDGPYGFNPDGPPFDQAVVEALKTGDPAPLLALPAKSCENAGECGLRSVLALLGFCQGPLEVFSYEGPFGVGYCTAFWKNKDMAAKAGTDGRESAGGTRQGHPFPRLARQTVARHLKGEALPGRAELDALSPDPGIWKTRKGCFVSIKTKNGALRGCIGTFLPSQDGLDAEIIANAVSAATRDPRFPPMRAEELEKVRFSVDVLNAPEPVSEGMRLDPAVYGVIVSKEGRRGLLLPDLEGVDSVEKQLAIAAQKAGIRNLAGAQIQRFTVDRYPEDPDQDA